MSEIINKIETERKRRGWTVYHLAKEAGITQQTLQAALRAGSMTTRTAEALMRVLGLGIAREK